MLYILLLFRFEWKLEHEKRRKGNCGFQRDFARRKGEAIFSEVSSHASWVNESCGNLCAVEK